jgi:hypothetical protein
LAMTRGVGAFALSYCSAIASDGCLLMWRGP